MVLQGFFSSRSFSPGFWRLANLGLMCVAMIGYGIGSSLFSPFFPTEAEKRGMTETDVGLIFSCYTFVMFIGTPLTGLLIRHLNLSFMTGAGMFITGVTTILFGFLDKVPSDTAYFVLCFAIRIVEGCGASMYTTAAYSTAAALYPDQVSFIYAVFETVNNVGHMLGPIVGGILFNLGGFWLPFVVAGALLLVIGALSVIMLKMSSSMVSVVEALSAKGPQNDSGKQQILSWVYYFRVSVHAWILSISQALAAVISSFPEPTIAPYFATLGLTDPAGVGVIFLVGTVIYVGVCLIVGKAVIHFEKHIYWIMAFGAAISSVSLLIIGPAPFLKDFLTPSVALTATGYTTLYIGVAFLLCPVPQGLSMSLRTVGYPDSLETSSLISSIYNGMWYAGGCFGPAAAGALMDSIGFPMAAFVMSLISALLTLILIIAASGLEKLPAICKRFFRLRKRTFKNKSFVH